MSPKYPIYIISKGRHELRPTAKLLLRCNVPWKIVIEPQEYYEYSKVIDEDKILVLPFSNLGLGSIPARNWVWEHSLSLGAKRHWILDDNIYNFGRVNRNTHIKVESERYFVVMEEFADRYENIAIAGPNYRHFVRKIDCTKPFQLNTRVYSCILIRNDLTYRWRGRYNEDTDLSIRCLKDGYCTILFNAFTIDKRTTMKMKGGNTDELYKDDGRLKMAQSLQKQHPDIVSVSEKWGRYQHHVDYSPFKKNKLILKSGLVIPKGVNNYGMVLRETDNAD